MDHKVKEGATERDVNVLLALLDLSNFIQLRDAVAVLVMYKTGIRISALTQLEEPHIDFNNNVINLEGSIMKNHQQIKLPFNDLLKRLLGVLKYLHLDVDEVVNNLRSYLGDNENE